MLCTTATVVRCCRKGSRRPRWESTGIVITHVNIAQPTGLSYLLPLLPIVTTKNIYIYSSDQIYKYILTRSCQELDIYRIFKFPTSWFAWIKQTEVPDSVNMTFCPNDKCDATTIWHRLCGAVGWAPSRVVPKTWASCSALMGGCKGAVHALCCHCLATSAAFTAKATAWPKQAQMGHAGHSWCSEMSTKPSGNGTERVERLHQKFWTGSQVKSLRIPRSNAKVLSECQNKQLIRLIIIVFAFSLCTSFEGCVDEGSQSYYL